MTTPNHSTAATAVPLRVLTSVLPSALTEAMGSLREAAQGIEAWLEARRRVTTDRDILARMSDRELLDIGLDRGSANFAGDGTWKRDLPY